MKKQKKFQMEIEYNLSNGMFIYEVVQINRNGMRRTIAECPLEYDAKRILRGLRKIYK